MTAFASLAPAHGAPRATRAGASDRPATDGPAAACVLLSTSTTNSATRSNSATPKPRLVSAGMLFPGRDR